MIQINRRDKFFISLCMLIVVLFLCAIGWNAAHAKYYLDWQWFSGTFGFCLTFIYAFLLSLHKNSVVRNVIKSVVMLYLILTIVEFCNTAVLTTPFPTHDAQIVSLDRLVGFHELIMLQWMQHLPGFSHFIWFFYFLLFALMHAAPIALAINNEMRSVYHYYFSFLISLIIGYAIFYFYPTMTSPAFSYPHHFFTAFQLNTLHQFELERAHDSIHFSLVGGVISFPSFHAIWAVLVMYALWSNPLLRYPIFIVGLIILASTILTGWHYFMDVYAGIAVAILSIWLAEKCLGQKEIMRNGMGMQ